MFKPINDDHAITEVAFVVQFEKEFPEAAYERLAKSHKAFKKELPKQERHQVFEFGFGNSLPTRPKPAPLSFSAFKRDGSIDWRMMISDNSLVINCLTYTRWIDISARAISLIREACRNLIEPNNGIVSIALQYVDAFKWAAKTAEYDVRYLLREDSPYIPASIFQNAGTPLWHLNQGFINPSELGPGGKLLQRINVESVFETGSYVTRMDTVVKLDFPQAQRRLAQAFFEDRGMVPEVFDAMHEMDKELTLAYITKEMADRIGLRRQEK